MEVFKAPAPPLVRRLAGSGGFNIFLVTVVVISTAYFIYNRRVSRQDWPGEVAPTNAASSANSAGATGAPPRPASPQELAAAGASAQNSNLEPLNVDASTFEENDVTVSTLNADPKSSLEVKALAANKVIAKVNAHPKLSVYFVEVPQGAVQSLFANVDATASEGTIPEFSRRFRDSKQISPVESRPLTLSRSEKIIDGPGVVLNFDQTYAEGKGFFIQASVINVSEGSTTLAIDIEYRHQPPGAQAIQVQEFQGQFILSNNSAAFFTDILARSASGKSEDDEPMSRHPVFKVLSSPAFLGNASEFFIFFELSNAGDSGTL